MPEANEVSKFRATDRLFDAIKDADYGTLFSYAVLRGIIERDPQQEGRSVILAVRKRLLRKHQKLLLPKIGEGYYIAFPGEHVDYAEAQAEQGDRKNNKALEATVFIDAASLSKEELVKLVDRQIRLRIKIVTGRRLEAVKLPMTEIKRLPSGQDLLGIVVPKKKRAV